MHQFISPQKYEPNPSYLAFGGVPWAGTPKLSACSSKAYQHRRNTSSFCSVVYLKQAIYHIFNSKCLQIKAVSYTQKCQWLPQPGCTGDISPCGWADGEDTSSCKTPHAFSTNFIRRDPEDNGWGRTCMFSQSGEDGKIGKGPAGSICKHFVNDPIFSSICSRLTCQLHGSDAGCSNGEG